MFNGGELSVVLATVAATGIIFVFVLMKRIGAKDEESKRYPPSVSLLSLIVSILQNGVNSLPHFFMKSAEKLGPVISFKAGGRLTVILNSKKALSEAFLKQSDTFSDRFEFWAEKNVSNPDLRGIIFARYNDNFKKYHRICLSVLKEFGLGLNRISETRILIEVESMIEKILKINGHSFDPTFLTIFSTSNVVLSILFCRQFMSVDRNQQALLHSTRDFVDNLDVALTMLPLLRFLPHHRRKIKVLSRGNEGILRAIEEGIEASKADQTQSTFVRRFMEIEGSDYSHQDLVYVVRDLCFGSLETASSALQWALVELANHAEVQGRLQREIDDVVPGNRFPCLDDKPNLPYAEAVILELLRRRCVVPIVAPHITSKDTELLGYFIPQGSMILKNIYSIHLDPMTWKDPTNFKPERFLDKDNNIIGSEKLLPFGLGKRSCPGEIVARQEIFLFLTSLVQRFDIRPPEDKDSIEVTEITSVTMHPSEFKVRLIPRKRFSSGIQN